jgi:tripartite-type tricarboxylate transporter receptor subunit TctC
MQRSVDRRAALRRVLGATCAVLAPRAVRAQAVFPNRTIRIVVPVAPGGGVDTFAGLIAA